MTATLNILGTACVAVMVTESFSRLIVDAMRRRSKQEPSVPGFQQETVAQKDKTSKASKRWTMGVARLSIVVAVISLALYWIAGSGDVWLVACLGALTLAVLAMFLGYLVRLLLNPRASLSRRLVRSTALVLAVAVAFVMIYCKLARV
jgi:hypothetical protein